MQNLSVESFIYHCYLLYSGITVELLLWIFFFPSNRFLFLLLHLNQYANTGISLTQLHFNSHFTILLATNKLSTITYLPNDLVMQKGLAQMTPIQRVFQTIPTHSSCFHHSFSPHTTTCLSLSCSQHNTKGNVL